MAIKDIFGRPPLQRCLVICTGPCCNKTGGADALLGGLRERLCSNGLAEAMIGHGSCVRRSCLGKCTGDPLAYIEPDGTWYHNLSIENLLLIIRDHLLCHKTVTELVLADDD